MILDREEKRDDEHEEERLTISSHHGTHIQRAHGLWPR